MNDLPVPMSRVEQYLAVAAGMVGATLPEAPMSRLEDFLAVIAGDTSVVLPTPMSLCELWLAYVAGVTPSEPLELEGAFHIGAQKVDVRFFAVAAGMEGVTAPEPQNRTEEYWARIAEIKPIHGVLKYVTGTSIALTDVVSGIENLETIFGDTTQQTYTGKNLYDELQLALNGNWTRLSDGSIERTVTTTGNMPTYSDSNVTNPIGTYTISFDLRIVTAGVTVTMNNSAYIWGVTSNKLNDGEGNPTTPTTRTLSSNWQRYSFTVTTTDALTWGSGRALHLYTYVVSAEATIQLRHLQIEQGSTPTAYEPYVGSSPSQITPSPNPDYPQPVNVVTGTQTVTISDGGGNTQTFPVDLTSKNLFDVTTITTGYLIASDGSLAASSVSFYSDYIAVEPDTAYTISYNSNEYTWGMRFCEYDSDKNFIKRTMTNVSPITNTTSSTTAYVRLSGLTADTDIKLEKGTSVDFYSLCKIGAYYDYIYRTETNWYIHKECGKYIANGSTVWAKSAYGTNTYSFQPSPICKEGSNQPDTILSASNCFIPVSYNNRTLATQNISYLAQTNTYFVRNTSFATVTDIINFCSNNNPIFYYVLATPTDTLITDPILISQLDAISNAVLPKPNANIEVTAAGTNLPGALEISYYGEEE